MAGTRAAIRYAKAVLSLASDQNAAEVVNSDMMLITNTVTGHLDLSEMLKSSVINSETKKTILLSVFPNLNKICTRLFEVLITNKRLNILNDVALKYSILFDELNGKEIAKVTTAVSMTNDLETKVLSKVKELTNKDVKIENIIDESILGGFILRVGDKQYDASISSKLNKLKREFTLN